MGRPRKHNKHLPPCVYERHGAFWLVRGGKWLRLGSTLAEAMTAYAAAHQPAGRGTMAGVIADAMVEILPRVKPTTRKQYELAAKVLRQAFAEFRVEQVTAADVAEFRADWASKPNMGNRHLSVLRAVFDWALERRLVTSNPCVGIKRHAEKKRTRLLTEAELTAIYAQAGERLRVIIDLAVGTGQRINDVLKIRRSDLTEDGIRFAQQKTGARLVVRWTPRLRDAVRRAAEMQGTIPTLTLLRNKKGKAPDYKTVQLQWDLACKAAKVADAHLHDLRAMAATAAKAQGLDAQQLLGHRTQANTARYLRDRSDVLVDGPSIGHVQNSFGKTRVTP